MISLKNLAKISFYFTCPNRINREEWWLSFLYPMLVGLFLAMFPFIIWEAAFLLVIVDILPEKIMIIVNFMAKLLAFFAFAVPMFYTFAIASIKRLHDLGHSGWWFGINIIPMLVMFIMNYFEKDIWFILTKVIPMTMFLFTLYVGFAKSKIGLNNCVDNA